MNQAPENFFQLRTYPTPDPSDLVFMEMVDSVLPVNQAWAYGDPHADMVRYPNFELVLVEPTPKSPGWTNRWYAAKRARQDEYNFTTSVANLGSTRFNTVVRAYILRRFDEFEALIPEMGSPMANVPMGLFGGAADSSGMLNNYLLAEREQRKTDDEHIDSRFVLELRTYIERTTMTDIGTDPTLGCGVGTVTTLYYRDEVITGASTIQALLATPANAYWGLQGDGTVRNGKQLSANWFAVIVDSTRDAAFLAYKQVVPSKVDLRLPDVMASAPVVVWNKSAGHGEFNSDWGGRAASSPGIHLSLSGSEQASANASGSIQPDLSLNIVQSEGRDIPSLSCFFFMKLVAGVITDAAFLARLSAVVGHAVSHWPVFHPVAHTIVLKGQKISVTAQASASASMSANNTEKVSTFSEERNFGTGTDQDASTMMGTTRIPPTIHGALTIAAATDSTTVQALCDVGWTGWGSGSILVDGTAYSVAFPTVASAADTTLLPVVGSVSPSVLAATVPASIPATGWYVTNIKLDPADAVWQRCYAEVFNAANL